MPSTQTEPMVDLSDHYVQAEIKSERIRLSDRQPSGVRWSGMNPEPVRARTLAELVEDANRTRAKDEAFAISPRGRFMACVRELRETGAFEAEALLNIWSVTGGFDDRNALDAEAVIRAIRILNSINTTTARKGVHALCDLVSPLLRAA